MTRNTAPQHGSFRSAHHAPPPVHDSAGRAGQRRRSRFARLAATLSVLGLVFVATAVTGLLLGVGGTPDEAADSGSSSDGGGLLPEWNVFGDTGSGEADGIVPDGTTVFDGDVPAVAGLDPELLDALRRAAGDAALDDVEFVVNGGWRSPGYQDQLLREAVTEYGAEEEAARWVATPEASSHVSGDAVDLGWWEATSWLSEHGATYGLCQIYVNESWHFELRPEAVDEGCPEMYADPTEDPRMQG